MISVKLSRIVRAFYAAQEPTALSTSALSALDDGRWEDLVRLSADPRSYRDATLYYSDAKCVGLLKKFEGLIPGVDREKTAIDKWWDAERQNYWTNQRLLAYVPMSYPGFRPGLVERNEVIAAFLAVVRKRVESWIGTAPPALCDGRFGPGATLSDKGQFVTVPDKISSIPTLTPGALGYLFQWGATMWARDASVHGRRPVFVRGNRFATVPKTALTDRSIGIEPGINVFYQLGLGLTLRKRLRNATGWDLDNVQDIHRRVARESSVSQAFATLDLSNASDTVCKNLVRILVPPQWVSQLEALRSPTTEVGGKRVYLEKFSSMGNGFTFELETIIFAALCSVVLEQNGGKGVLGEDLCVFGDDLIVPDGMVREVTAVLNFCGFTVNEEKSFSGPIKFRESCGGDYFNGSAVRPYFIKKDPFIDSEDITAKISCVNGIRRVLAADLEAQKPPALLVWRRALDRVPLRYQHFGPEWLGDTVVHSWNDEHWTTKCGQWGTPYIKILCARGGVIPWAHWRPDVKLASLVYGVGDGLKGVTPRDPCITYVSEWVPLLRNNWLPGDQSHAGTAANLRFCGPRLKTYHPTPVATLSRPAYGGATSRAVRPV